MHKAQTLLAQKLGLLGENDPLTLEHLCEYVYLFKEPLASTAIAALSALCGLNKPARFDLATVGGLVAHSGQEVVEA